MHHTPIALTGPAGAAALGWDGFLGLAADRAYRRPDRIPKQDRIELAVEHALRDGLIDLADLRIRGGAATPELSQIRSTRGTEPPTESYAETRALQLFRAAGWLPWRQVHIASAGRIVQRADFAIPFRRSRRPEVVRPEHALLVEIDGRGFHEATFERDHRRQTNYDYLGYRWTSFTPTQIEFEPIRVCTTVERLLSRGP